MNLPNRLNRDITIEAPRDLVFQFFTDTPHWAAWWGAGSTIDPRPGGKVYIRHPNGVEVSGEVLEVAVPERIVFTYGYASGAPIGPGQSRVTIHLDESAAGTRLRLAHDFADAAARDQHVQGWRFQLSLFSNVVANELHAGAAGLVDAWFDAWAEPDDSARRATLDRIAAPGVRFRDQYSLLDGLDDLSAHIAGALRFMPGMRLKRDGNVRHCQGTVLVNWVAVSPDGQQRGGGANVFVFGADRRILSVAGFWNPASA